MSASANSFRYQHRPLSPAPPPVEPGRRLLESVTQFRAQCEQLADENRHLREVNASLDAKVKQYMSELDTICKSLGELKRTHKHELDAYTNEKRSLLADIAAAKAAWREFKPLQTAPPPPPPPQRRRSPSPDSADRERERDPRDRHPRESKGPLLPLLRPATFTPEPGAAEGSNSAGSK